MSGFLIRAEFAPHSGTFKPELGIKRKISLPSLSL